MQHELTYHATRLARGRMHPLVDARGTRVLNLQGTLWMTQEGDMRDIVLEPGDVACVDHGGLTILSALRDARFVLLQGGKSSPPAPAGVTAASPSAPQATAAT